MRRIPSIGFSLDAEAPVPVRRSSASVPVVSGGTVIHVAVDDAPKHEAPPPPARFEDHIRTVQGAGLELAEVLNALQNAFKAVAALLRFGARGLPSNLDAHLHASGSSPTRSATPGVDMPMSNGRASPPRDILPGGASTRAGVGGDVASLDKRVAMMLIDALRRTGRCSAVAAETHEGVFGFDSAEAPAAAPAAAAPAAASNDPYSYYGTPTPAAPPPRKRYAVVLDPLDGKQNADAGVSIGTIFGVYDASHHDESVPTVMQVLRRGEEMVAAGYAVYGAATQLVLSCGNGVHGYSLDPGHVPTPFMSGTFMLTRPGMRMPRTGRVYAANLGHRKGWSRDVQAHIDDLGHTKSLRYIGTLVSDVHRTLLYGGVFLYPASMKRPQGKIRLIYEAAPLAFLLEQAGGGASTGRERILALQPSGLSQCTPVAFGSLLDVEEYVRTCGAMGVVGAAGGYIEGVRVSGDGDGLPEGGCMSRSASELALEGRGGAEEDNLSGVLGGDAEDSEEDSDDFSGVL